MRLRIVWVVLALFGFWQLQGQDVRWEVQVNTDSLLMGNNLKVTFNLSNAKGKQFQSPNFEGFQLVSGPNQSSSMSIINGDVSRELAYTFFLAPLEEGNYYIEPAVIYVDGEALETAPIEVVVFPNPDGIQQREPRKGLRWENLPWDKPEAPRLDGKKKRKIYRI